MCKSDSYRVKKQTHMDQQVTPYLLYEDAEAAIAF